MSDSQNLAFTGPSNPIEELDHPKGEAIARILEHGLATANWCTEHLDIWRDIGWEVEVSREETRIDIRLAAHDTNNNWMLQITPRQMPSYWASLIKRIQGKPVPQPSATHEDMFEVAKLVHKLLIEKGYTNLRWSFSDPYSDQTTEHPILFSSTHGKES